MSSKVVLKSDKIALKAGAWYVVSEIVIRGISFLATPIFTRLLSTVSYGDVKTFEAWLYLFAPILSIGIYNSIERAKFDFKDKYKSYVSSVIFLMFFIGVIAELICFPLKSILALVFDCSEKLIWLIPAYAICNSSILCLQKHERQMMNYKNVVLISFLVVLFSLLPSIIFVVLYHGKVTDEEITILRIYSFYMPLCLLGSIMALVSFIKGKVLINLNYWKFAISFSLPFVFYSISMQILNQSDKIMIKKLCGSELAGIYAVATTVVYIMDVLNNAVQGAWMPWMFEKLNVNGKNQIQKIWKIMIVAMGLLTWVIVMLGPELILFLGGKKYNSAVWLLGPMVTGSFIHFITVGYTNVEKFYKKTKCVTITSLLSIIVNLVLNYFCIIAFGYKAAAYTTAISYLVSALVHWIFMKRYNLSDILPGRTTFSTVGVFFVLNLFSMFSYKIPFYVRWTILIFVILGLGLKFKDFFEQAYKEFRGVKKTNE